MSSCTRLLEIYSMHAVHLRDKTARAARNGDPGVSFLHWGVGSKWWPPDKKSNLLPQKNHFLFVLYESFHFSNKMVSVHLLQPAKRCSSKLKILICVYGIFLNEVINYLLTTRIKSELTSDILHNNIYSYTSIRRFRKKGFTYNGHFLLQVIHVLAPPLLLLRGSVIFVLCGGNAVTVWPPILQTHTHVLYMPSD